MVSFERPGLRAEETVVPALEQPCGRPFFRGALGLSGTL